MTTVMSAYVTNFISFFVCVFRRYFDGFLPINHSSVINRAIQVKKNAIIGFTLLGIPVSYPFIMNIAVY
jgi:hypothetical protein